MLRCFAVWERLLERLLFLRKRGRRRLKPVCIAKTQNTSYRHVHDYRARYNVYTPPHSSIYMRCCLCLFFFLCSFFFLFFFSLFLFLLISISFFFFLYPVEFLFLLIFLLLFSLLQSYTLYVHSSTPPYSRLIRLQRDEGHARTMQVSNVLPALGGRDQHLTYAAP